jgi:hypothetical protein
MDAAAYTATEHLRSGAPLQIRSLRPDERARGVIMRRPVRRAPL